MAGCSIIVNIDLFIVVFIEIMCGTLDLVLSVAALFSSLFDIAIDLDEAMPQMRNMRQYLFNRISCITMGSVI